MSTSAQTWTSSSALRWLLLAIGLLCLWSTGVDAAVLHGTDQEIALWQQRRTDPAYQAEWQRILGRANQFAAQPEPRYAGNTTGRCYNGSLYHLAPERTQDAGMRDAGFAYLLTKDARYLAPVQDALLAQTRVAGTQFGDGQRWCPSTADYHGYGDNISPWLRRVAYAYSYVKDDLAPQDRQQIDGWLREAGQHLATVVHNVVAKRFPNRLQDDYGGCRYGCSQVTGLTHAGGTQVTAFHEAWQNKGASMSAAMAVIGTLVGDGTLQSQAARFVQEWLKYGVYPGGQVHDQYRWSEGTPQHGYLYSGATLGSILTAVDVLARDGAANLYEYTTSEGLLGTQGGPKSLHAVMRHFAGLTTGTVKEYASHSPTSNPALLITPEGPQMRRMEQVVLAGGNLYFQDPAIRAAYTRPLSGAIQGSGCDMRGGDWCTYPDVRFLYGGLEGHVAPYGGMASRPPMPQPPQLPTPSKLRILGQ